MKYLLDSNIIIYHLNGEKVATDFIENNIESCAISQISYVEVLSFDFENEETRSEVKDFLECLEIIDTNKFIAIQCLHNRKNHRRRVMKTRFSEDIVPMTDLKINPGKIIRHVQESHRPVVLTSRGRGVAVVQSLSDFEDQADQRIFMKGVLEGMIDIEEGRELSLEDVKNRLKIK